MKSAKTVRILTLAPLMALITLCTLFIFDSTLLGGAFLFSLAVLFLTVLPLLAYPLQRFIPHFKHKGREGQRSLAMIFAVSGYVLGCLTNLFLSAPASLWFIYLGYLISGALILVTNKLLGLRASAHACGVVGPTVILATLGLPIAIFPGIALYLAALWASLKMRRHTVAQFIGGAIIPICVLMILSFTMKF